MFNPTLIF